MQRIVTRFFSTSLLLVLFSSCVFAASDEYVKKYGAQNFTINQDALKYEIPERGLYKVIPRLKDSAVWTQFAVPEKTGATFKEWQIEAVVKDSDGAGAGVAIWFSDRGYAFYLFPDGGGYLRCFEGKKATWSSEVRVRNFAYPARLALYLDPNGSVIAKLDDKVCATCLFEVDLNKSAQEDVTSASFVTHSEKNRSGLAAYFESMEIRGWNKRKPSQ